MEGTSHMTKIVSRTRLTAHMAAARAAGRRIVFTNGCFDILHAGHVQYLSAARSRGDLLVVGLNSDHSVKSIKGSLRPVVAQDHRAQVVAGLACVDYVTIFDEPDPAALIRAVKPDLLVKGADWAEGEIIGADFVTSRGGHVARIPLMDGISTSGIIAKILQLASGPDDS